jgi:2-(3-amino-3-carboxypropyl)histidine synthase
MEEAIKELKRLKTKRVFVQYPEGLKIKIQDISKQLEKEGFECLLSLEPTFGGCDVRDCEAKKLKCDAVLHIGHSDFGIESSLPVVYWEYFLDANPQPALVKEFDKLKDYDKIGLITSVQFVKTIPQVKEFLEKRGKKVFVHKSLKHDGQILGCKLEAAKEIENKVDCFLCISAGKFYPLGLALKTNKPLFNLDLERSEISDVEEIKKKILKIKIWNKAQLKEAKRVGILVSWKRGQMLGDPFIIKKNLEKEGKEVYVFAMDEVAPQKLEGLKLDALISCACPRIAIDDLERYKIPIVNIEDLYS